MPLQKGFQFLHLLHTIDVSHVIA